MSEYLDLAVEAATRAGAFLRGRFGQRLVIEKKGAINIVTDADRKSEKMIREMIFSRFPSHRFKAEEGTEAGGESPFLWLVDPLDGTTNYAHGFPVYCVSVALVKESDLSDESEILAGCIYNPNLEECFTAERGGGAFLNGKAIEVSKTLKLDDAFLATGFPYDIRTSEETNLREFAAFAVTARAIRRAGSAALDLAYLACGRFDGYWEQKLSPWDIAAGVLLVEEAGGRVTSWKGQKSDIFKGDIVASNGRVHDEMLSVLGKVRS
jgi:myo-inositol-1(or 4)-monophosphatase